MNAEHGNGKCMCQLCAPDWVFNAGDRFTVRVDSAPDVVEHTVRAGSARAQAREAATVLADRYRKQAATVFVA